MPSPSSTAFLRPDLGESFQEWSNEAEIAGFVGLQLLPPKSVALQNASFSRIPLAQLLKDVDTLRAPGSGYARDEWKFDQDSYLTKEYGKEEPLDDRERAIFGYTGIDFDMIAAARARAMVMRGQELRIATALQDVGTIPTETTTNLGAGPWDVPATGTPIADVLAATELFKGACGLLPNTVLITDKVWRTLESSEEIKERVKYWGGDDPKENALSLLAALWKVDRVVVAAAVRNTASAGVSPATPVNIWTDDSVGLYKVCQTDDLREPCIGRTFMFAGDGGGTGGIVEQYREEKVRGDVVRFRMDADEKVIYPACGFVITGVFT